MIGHLSVIYCSVDTGDISNSILTELITDKACTLSRGWQNHNTDSHIAGNYPFTTKAKLQRMNHQM